MAGRRSAPFLRRMVGLVVLGGLETAGLDESEAVFAEVGPVTQCHEDAVLGRDVEEGLEEGTEPKVNEQYVEGHEADDVRPTCERSERKGGGDRKRES